MDKKYVADNLSARMVGMGYATSSVDVSTSGEYLVEDAMWNTMDLRHADRLHPQVDENTPFFVDHHVCCYVIHINVLGVTFPIVGTTYLVDEGQLGAVLNLPFGFLVKSDIRCTQESETRTTVRVNYTILSHRYLKFMHRLIALSLSRNFSLLMKDDNPMRARKMELRRLGFAGMQNPLSFLNSLDISTNNIRFDRGRTSSRPADPVSIPLEKLASGASTRIELTPEKSFLVLSSNENMLIFPAYCPHEGARLDEAECRDDHLTCPWHGRRLKPLCRIAISDDSGQRQTALRLDGFNVTVRNDGHCLQFDEVPP